VKLDGAYVAGIREASGLQRASDVVHRAGGDPSSPVRASPGRTGFEPVTLERGITHDAGFERWASRLAGRAEALGGSADLRRDLVIDVFNEAGRKVRGYKVLRAWVSEYQAMPDLDANANAVAIEHITLENEGCVRHDHARP
jgi:phage tail-like protein